MDQLTKWPVAHKKAEQTLYASEELHRTILESLTEGVVIVDKDFRITYANPTMATLVGYTTEELVGISTYVICSPDHHTILQQKTQQRLSGVSENYEIKLRRKDSTEFWAIINAAPYCDGKGEIIGAVGVVTDITGRKAIEAAQEKLLQEVQESERLIRTIIDSTPDWIFIKDREHRFRMVNRGYATSMHLTRDEIIGKTDLELGIPEDIVKGNPRKGIRGFWADDTEVMDSGEMKFIPSEPIVVDGEARTLSTIKAPLLDDRGEAWGILGYVRDITENTKVEEQLRQKTEQLSEALTIARLAPWQFDVETGIFTLSDHFYALLGTTAEQEGGYLMTGEELMCKFSIPAEDHSGVSVEFERALDTTDPNYSSQFEHRITRADGREIYFQVRLKRTKDEHGQIKIYGINQDITDRKRTEDQLRKLSRAVEQSASTIVITDTQGYIEYVNPRFVETSGYTYEEAMGQHTRILKSGETPPEEYERLWKTITAGQEWHGELYNKKKNGEFYWESAAISPIKNESGVITHFLAVKEEITARKQAEVELRQTTSELKAIFQALPDLFFRLAPDGTILHYKVDDPGDVYVPPEVFLGKRMQDVLPSEVALQIHEAILRVQETKARVSIEYILLVPAGEKYFEARLAPMPDGQIIFIVRNITDRQRAEQELYRQRQLVQGVAEATSHLLTHQDLMAAIDQALAILGKTAQVDRVYIFENHPYAAEQDEYAISQRFEWVNKGIEPQTDNLELQYLPWREAGFVRWYETLSKGGIIAGPVYEFPASERAILEAQQIRSLLAVPIFMDDTFWGFIGFDDCQTERRWSTEEKTILRTMAASIGGALAREQTKDELARARDEALAAAQVKTEFLANMSHEIRTPLNAVIGMTGLLLDTELKAEQRDFVETIRTSGDGLLTIINDILDFTKIEAKGLELDQHPFELRSCIEEALDLVAPQAAEKRLDVAYIIEDQLPYMFIGDVTRLRQILVNLLGNVVKFTDTGEIVVSVTSKMLENDWQKLHFSVQDSGIGIPEDRLNRLFQSFSQVDASTTRRYGGTGLGLVISKRLCELMGGSMWVESVVGEGSTFHFTILTQPTSEPEPAYLHSNQLKLSGKRVLIVDDSETNRRILSHQTQSWGMLPEAVSSGSQALELINQGRLFDLAILDMYMPEMDGLMLASKIREHYDTQTLPLILFTSLGQHDNNRETPYFAAYLTKPIKPAQLYNVLINIVDGQTMATKQVVFPNQFDRHMGERCPLRILLAEDNVVNQKVALGIFGRLGYRADVAANGLEVLEALSRQAYDVIFMDVQMPEMDGVEATHRIRQAWPVTQQPRIIAMTANAMPTDRQRYLNEGMDDYVSKPIKIEDLIRAFKDCQVITPSTNQKSYQDRPNISPMEASQKNIEHSTVAPAVDFSVLEEFQTMMGDGGDEIVQELVTIFLEDTPDLLIKMRQGAEAGNIEQIWRAAHTLKSSSANLGVMKLSSLCQEIEMLGKAGMPEETIERLTQIETEYVTAKQALTAVLQTG